MNKNIRKKIIAEIQHLIYEINEQDTRINLDQLKNLFNKENDIDLCYLTVCLNLLKVLVNELGKKKEHTNCSEILTDEEKSFLNTILH